MQLVKLGIEPSPGELLAKFCYAFPACQASLICLQIRSKARGLKEKFPLEACSKEVQDVAKASKAAALAKRAQLYGSHMPRRRPGRHPDPASEILPAHLASRNNRSAHRGPRISKFHGANDVLGREDPSIVVTIVSIKAFTAKNSQVPLLTSTARVK